MLGLSYEEIKRLQKILIEHCRSKSPSYLESLIINSKIEEKNLDINYYLPVFEWVEIIQAKLSTTYSLDNNIRRLNFVLFLEYFQFKLSEISDEISFVNDIINKLEQTLIFESSSRKNNIKNLLACERQEQPKLSTIYSSNISQRIDKSIIVDHDLEEIQYTLKQRLGFRGVFAVSVSGHDTILKEYIIQRILHELKNRSNPPRCYRQPINIRLYNHSICQQLQVIEQELKKYNICNQLTDLVQITNKLDTVIIIWNYDIDKNKIETIADEFLTAIKTECLHLLKENNQCLIVILANVFCQTNINKFISLRTPEKFILEGANGLLEWFNYQLSQLPDLQSDYIDQYLNRIERQNGHLIGTYQEIQDIIDELNGRILNNG